MQQWQSTSTATHVYLETSCTVVGKRALPHTTVELHTLLTILSPKGAAFGQAGRHPSLGLSFLSHNYDILGPVVDTRSQSPQLTASF